MRLLAFGDPLSLMHGAQTAGFMKWRPNPNRSLLEDRRGVGESPEYRAALAEATPESRREIKEFIRTTGWPDNWEETESPALLRRRNPDGSYDYERAIPEDLFGEEAAYGSLSGQADEFTTPRVRRTPGRW